MEKSNHDMGKVILQSEFLLSDFLQKSSNKINSRKFLRANIDRIKILLPKISENEFVSNVKNFRGTSAQLLRKLVLSQCKTPMPKGSEKKIDIHLSINFSSEKLDRLLNNGEIITFNHNYKRLFGGHSLSPIATHVALVTGRKWNSEKNRCEYRVVNSHGDQCHKVVETEDVSCSKHGGMWVSESYLSYSHWSHEYASGIKEAGIHKKPHHPALDPDSIE